MRQTRGGWRALGLGAVLVAGTACQDRPIAGPAVNLSGVVPVGMVQPVVIREAGVTPGESILTVRVHGTGVEVGAYQGEVTYDPKVVTVVATALPEAEGEYRVLNAAEVGRIRFAAFTAAVLKEEVALRLTVRLSGAWSAAAVRATLEAVGNQEGAALAESAFRSTSAIYDARTGATITP